MGFLAVSKRRLFVTHHLSSGLTMHQPLLQQPPLCRYDLVAPCLSCNTFLSLSALGHLCHHSTSRKSMREFITP